MKHVAPLLAALTFAGSAMAAPITGVSGLGNPVVPGATAVIDFESLGNVTAPAFVLGPVTFTGLNGNLRADNSFAGQYNGRGARYLDNDAGATSMMRFDFAAPVSAFAFNWGASDTNPWSLTAFDASNNALETFNLPLTFGSNAGDYVGLAVAGIAYATLSGPQGDWIFIENFTIAAGDPPAAVAEPASLALFSLGLAALGLRRRRSE